MARQTWFDRASHGRLIFNACWEDPHLDRIALDLGPEDEVLVLTSAGCNALAYALDAPRRIVAVDMNPFQNALLELKLAAIRELDYEAFFALFGYGRLAGFGGVYRTRLRPHLSMEARMCWDERLHYFDGHGTRSSFYFHGANGLIAWLMNQHIDHVARIRTHIDALLDATSLDEQAEVYERHLRRAFWHPVLRWALNRGPTHLLLGVPPLQRQQLEREHGQRIAGFIEDRVGEALTQRPIGENYFWRAYLTGSYSVTCCPDYLRPEGFARLKSGLVDCIEVHTGSVFDFVSASPGRLSRFVLLDHMDWLGYRHPEALQQEWEGMLACATSDARFIWRSAGSATSYLDGIAVGDGYVRGPLTERLSFQSDQAAALHAQDRVNTYGSFHIADLQPVAV